ncbi:replication initiator protein A [Bradyrhizobium sp. HKCCYLRH1073]|uniref:replication initiator protein A n=1 Tax=unclassified Bradyrhizobium TaxID=2631580 RepID=UPI003EBE35EE
MTELGRLIAERLEAQLGADAFRDWFRGASFELAGDRVKVIVGTKFAANVIAQNFADAVRSVASGVIGRPLATVMVAVRGEKEAPDVTPIETILRAVAPDDAQRDFFIPELSELALKDDVHLMEMTPFTLQARGETRKELVYTTPQGVTIRVQSTGELSLPTIDDYDLVLMMQTWLADLANQYRSQVERYEAEKKAGRSPVTPTPPPRMFEVSISEVVKFKRRKWGGAISDDILGSLDRLWNTEVVVDPIKGTKYRGGKFRLVGSAYEKLSETDNGKASRVRVAVPDWIYSGIVERAVPMLRTFNRDYMILTQPLHRALYRFLSLKVPKDGKPFSVSLTELAQRFQTKQQQKYFNRDFKKAVASCPNGQLLEFRLELLGKGDDKVLRAWRPLLVE